LGPPTTNTLAKAVVIDRTTLGRYILPLERRPTASSGGIDLMQQRAGRIRAA